MVARPAVDGSDRSVRGLRIMDPTRDLGVIARLIATAFADELDDRGRAALREMRWMARLSPLVWWLAQTDPAFRESFNGFVWEETSPGERRPRIVGNVSLNQAPGADRRWVISNVVVKDEYRGRGIGRRLTEAAVAEARWSGAQSAVLQVYLDNAPALRLYTDLGFQQVAAETALRLAAVQPVTVADAAGYRIRAWQPGDAAAANRLARLVTPSAHQWLRPVRAGEYRTSAWSRFWQGFSGLAGGQRTYRLVAVREDRFVALMTVLASYRSGTRHHGHRITLLVHPEHAGRVEEALASRALHLLSAIPPAPIVAFVDSAHDAVYRVLRDFGFREQRTLLTLSLDFGSRNQHAQE